MDDSTISTVVAELAQLLVGRGPGKIFQLSHHSLAIDFGLRQHGYLFIGIEPSAPRLYLIKRRVRDLEKASMPLTPFSLSLRKELARTSLTSVEKLPNERVVVLRFAGLNELGERTSQALILQLTGRSANLFLLNAAGAIIARSRETRGAGQSPGEKYEPPQSPVRPHRESTQKSIQTEGRSLSEALDEHYATIEASRASESRLAAARAHLTKEISRRQKLIKQLERDLSEHANAEANKRIGDLLLANVNAPKAGSGRLKLIDYFAEGTPEIEVDVKENRTIPEEAAYRFGLYSRSKRARVQIANRIKHLKTELAELEVRREQPMPPADVEVESASARDPRRQTSSTPGSKRIPGARHYVSSDGYEILVGRAARDNDTLTFKVGKPNDLWLHAADYPGSHVIVRNPTRKEIPQRTLFEAAQLAAYFSQASKDPKVDVHYTERKFLSKPKGAAAGMVRMSRFKTAVVKPGESIPRI